MTQYYVVMEGKEMGSVPFKIVIKQKAALFSVSLTGGFFIFGYENE